MCKYLWSYCLSLTLFGVAVARAEDNTLEENLPVPDCEVRLRQVGERSLWVAELLQHNLRSTDITLADPFLCSDWPPYAFLMITSGNKVRELQLPLTNSPSFGPLLIPPGGTVGRRVRLSALESQTDAAQLGESPRATECFVRLCLLRQAVRPALTGTDGILLRRGDSSVACTTVMSPPVSLGHIDINAVYLSSDDSIEAATTPCEIILSPFQVDECLVVRWLVCNTGNLPASFQSPFLEDLLWDMPWGLEVRKADGTLLDANCLGRGVRVDDCSRQAIPRLGIIGREVNCGKFESGEYQLKGTIVPSYYAAIRVGTPQAEQGMNEDVTTQVQLNWPLPESMHSKRSYPLNPPAPNAANFF